MDKLKFYYSRMAKNGAIFLKWLIVSMGAGLLLGLIGSAFYHLLAAANAFRTEHPQIIYFLPFSGFIIVFLYRMAKDDGLNTNIILSAIHSDTNVPLKITPLIFISTIITNLFGGSAGREGAAVQIGGGIGYYLGGLIKLDEFDRRVFTMCCVSAAFSAVFGTPIAAAIFAIEVVSVGIMYYSALVPCAIASLTANTVAKALDCRGEQFHVLYITEFKFDTGIKALIMAIIASLVSILFVVSLKYCEYHFKKYIKNQYLRVFTGGLIIVVLTLLLKTTDYNGVGIPVMERAFRGEVEPEALLFKIIFTAITLGCGFKGGEIMPSFYIGSTLGCFVGRYMGISPSLCAAIGMVSVFCGVTNCPIASLIISLELFGMEGIHYYLLAIAVSYMLSGYYGLYSTQKIIYSKYKNQYVNKIAHH